MQWDFGSKAGSQGLSFLLALLNLLQYNKFHTLLQVNFDQPAIAVLDFSYTPSSSQAQEVLSCKVFSEKSILSVMEIPDVGIFLSCHLS